MSTGITLAHSASNSAALEEARAKLMKDAREIGSLIAQGKDGLPNLAIKVAYAANNGIISGDKDADGLDDYHHVYAEAVKTMSKKAVHEHTAGGLKANASKLRQIGNAATKTTCDFVKTIGKAIDKRKAMMEAEVKVKPCYAALVDMARTQNDQDDDLTPEQIEQHLRKPEPKEKDAETEIGRAADILENLVKGDKGVSDTSPEVRQALDHLNARLTQMLTQREVAETLAKARSLGLIVTPEVTGTELAA